MSATELVTLIGVMLLVGVSAVLASAETVLVRLGLVRALALREEERRGSAALLRLAENPARGLHVVLVLTISVRIAAAGMLSSLALRWGATVVTLALLVLVLVSFVLAEAAPRTYTLRNVERIGLLLAPGLELVTRGLVPLVGPLVAAGRLLAGRARTGPFSSEEELRRLGAHDDEDDEVAIEEDERAMIHSIFELGETVCREIMVPRPDMTTVSRDASFEEVVDLAVSRGYSRIPVWGDDRDDIVGVVYAKDLLERLHEATRELRRDSPGIERRWDDLVREPTFVPESKRADDLLRDLQRQQVHLAIVVDEHGAVVGLVSIEDILEEIVGEIVDEYDREDPPVVRLDGQRLRVSARLTVHDLNELIGAELPEDEGWDTVGGLVIGMLGRVPQPGESVRVDGVTLVAERVQGRRVSKVLVHVASEEPVV